MRLLMICLLALSSLSCAQLGARANTESYGADGAFVRHTRIRVAPAQTKDFERLIERCAQVAEVLELSQDHDWLCYLESPGRYWLLTFSDDREGFAIPTSNRPLRSFVRYLASLESREALIEIEEQLANLEYEVEWSLLARQKQEWSTDRTMSTTTHPRARMMMRRVRAGQEAAFEQALASRTAFLAERSYPLPVEGFVVLSGAPGVAMQVVFPRDWPSFHASESFWEFAQQLPEGEREQYMLRKNALMRSMAGAEYYDAKFLEEESYVHESRTAGR